MEDMQFITIAGMMKRYGISRRKAEEVAFTVGTAPRQKRQMIYVSLEKADAYMKGEWGA